MEIVSTIGLITINATMLHQLIAFLIFLFIINRIMFRPLRSVMGERDSVIEKIKQETTDADKELDRLNQELKEEEAAVRNEAQDLRHKIEENGTREAGKILEAIRQEIKSIKEKTEADVQDQILKSKKNLQKESESLAITIMEKLLDRRLVP